MTRIEYDLVRAERPELRLPRFEFLRLPWRESLETLSANRLIARRTAVLLAREHLEIEEPFEAQKRQPDPEPLL